ncbi:MAG: hypothetical protein H0X45_02160 [Planctomycetes bacterium]|nr:hypothetical protein [Planctomycetota bacterium]
MIRHGSILIVVAGISALLAALALAFLGRMRSDAEEMALVTREAQAKIMLVAACNYVQEASRLGYDLSSTPTVHEECFGWVDVRDGNLGPKFAIGPDDASRWPLNTARRFPMYVAERPPWAVQLTVAYNPIQVPVAPANGPWPAPLGRPYLAKPDPQPVSDSWADYRDGDARPRSQSTDLSWFRLYREGPAQFVVTCGAGSTLGFRDWPEVTSIAGAADQFANDNTLFEAARQVEVRRWYLIEWNAAVGSSDYHNLDNDINTNIDNLMIHPMNSSHSVGVHSVRTQSHCRNMGGTIKWVQRLRHEPSHW